MHVCVCLFRYVMYVYVYIYIYIYIYIYMHACELQCEQTGPGINLDWGHKELDIKYLKKNMLQHKYDIHSIFMDAIALCLLLNKLHLFSRTQHRFILIQIVPLKVCYTFRPVLKPSSGNVCMRTVGVWIIKPQLSAGNRRSTTT